MPSPFVAAIRPVIVSSGLPCGAVGTALASASGSLTTDAAGAAGAAGSAGLHPRATTTAATDAKSHPHGRCTTAHRHPPVASPRRTSADARTHLTRLS